MLRSAVGFKPAEPLPPVAVEWRVTVTEADAKAIARHLNLPESVTSAPALIGAYIRSWLQGAASDYFNDVVSKGKAALEYDKLVVEGRIEVGRPK